MDEMDKGQVVPSAAEVYDQFFLPALFAAWPERVLEAAQVGVGDSVLDVACGTGVLTLAAAEKVGPQGSVVGLDVNEGMLAVARKKDGSILWRKGQAEALSFPEHGFDAVVSQFGLMFFEDQRLAVREMSRVLRPGGRLAVAVWDSLKHTPGYAAITGILHRLFGSRAADALRAPFSLGDKAGLRNLFDGAGLADVQIATHPGTARFPSLKSWMYTEVKGWILADILSDAQFDLLLREAARELAVFVREDGTVRFSTPAHIVTAQKV